LDVALERILSKFSHLKATEWCPSID